MEEDECVAASDCPTYPGVYVGFDTDGDGAGDGPDPFFDSGLVTIDESEFEEDSGTESKHILYQFIFIIGIIQKIQMAVSLN